MTCHCFNPWKPWVTPWTPIVSTEKLLRDKIDELEKKNAELQRKITNLKTTNSMLSERCKNQRSTESYRGQMDKAITDIHKIMDSFTQIGVQLYDKNGDLRPVDDYMDDISGALEERENEEIEGLKDEVEKLQNDKDYYKHKCEEFEQRLQDVKTALRLERYEHRDTKTLLDAALERETAEKIAHENTLEMLDMANETLAKIKDLADIQYKE